MKSKILLKRLLPVIILFIAINTGLGIEYGLRVPREWYTSTPAGEYNTLDNPVYNATSQDMAVDTAKKIAYVSSGTKLLIFNVENIDNPILLSEFNKNVTAKFIAYQEFGDLLVVTGTRDFNIVNVSDPENPVNMSVFTWHYFYHATDVEFIDDFVYLLVSADGTNSSLDPYHVMYIVNVTDPYNPIETVVYRQYGLYPTEFTIYGNVAYIADNANFNGIRTVDISNKSAPITLGNYQFFGLVADFPQGVYVRDTEIKIIDSKKYIMIADEDNGYIIGDMTNPYNPQVIDGELILDDIVSIDVTFGYSWLLTDTGRVYVYSLDKPTKFRIVGKFDPYDDGGVGLDIFVHEPTSTMYILRNNGLAIFRLTEGEHNDYYREEAKFSYTWIGIGLSLIICVPIAISIVMRHRDTFTYSSRF